MTTDESTQKRALRAELRERRRTMPTVERSHADAAITQHLIELASDPRYSKIAAYLSTRDEPSTRGFLHWASEQGIDVLLPIAREDGLLDWAHHDDTDENEDILGMPTPGGELLGPIAINKVDLIIVPAASVDRRGMRLGWGRGYFDKTLGSMEQRPPVYAVIFDSELVDSVPTEMHDQGVDGVVTPAGITRF